MGPMGTEGSRASESGGGREGNASPAGSICAADFTPPSPCLHEIGDDDATPRQQWSPVHTVGGGAQPARTRGYSGGSAGGGTFAGAGERRGVSGGSGSAPKVGPSAGTFAASSNSSSGSNSSTQNNNNCAAAAVAAAASAVAVLHQRHSPDSPVMRVDLERLDLSVLALGEEGGPTVPSHRLVASEDRTCELLHPGAFRSEPGPIGQGGRPRSLGGRPSRVHALFVAPGQLGTGPASPPSSYSTHSESGFASPTARLASPFGGVGAAGAGGREYHHHYHHQHHHHQQGRVKKGHWKKGKPIGVGSCGNVYLGMNEDTGELMAVKEITLETKDRLLTSLYNEIQVMHKLVHPHIVGYLGAELQDSKRKLCIFQEWVPAGSLHSLLGQFGALSDAMTRKYTKQVLEGLVYLHANRVIHRDVKSKNILVDDRGNVKLADFGCALVLKDDNGDGVEMSMKGTPLFMAPEMLLKRKCGKRVDVWSLGCAVLEMLTTRPPWADTFKHPVEIIEHFSSNPGPPPLPDNLSPTLRDFLLSCFTWDAERRPTSHQLSGHEYLRAPRPSADGGGGSSSGNGPDSGDDNDIPLEAMGRAPFISRMRRCSSATLPELLQRSNALGGVGGVDAAALATFGMAPSGTLRPPSPRYGPGGVAGGKRTPTRRRVYTESNTAMPPPEGNGGGGLLKPVVSAAATVGAGAFSHAAAGAAAQDGGPVPTRGLVRRSSMPNARSPPASPERPRRPGRGSSPGRGSTSTLALPQQIAQLQFEEEGRMGSGPIRHARLRSTGDARAFAAGGGGHWSTGIGDGRFGRLGHAGVGRGASASSSGGGGGTDSDAWVSRTPAGFPVGSASFTIGGAGVGSAGGGGSHGHILRQAAPTPKLPPIVGELLGTLEQSGGEEAAGGTVVRSGGDSPPPTVRPLEPRRSELRRSVSAQPGHVSWEAGGSSSSSAGGGVPDTDAKDASTRIASPKSHNQASASGGGGGGGSGGGGIWGAADGGGVMSDARDGGGVAGSRQTAGREGEE